jgi:hypothetical protein
VIVRTLILLLLLFPLVSAKGVAEDAEKALSQAELDVQEVVELGLSASYFTDALENARKAMETEDYPRVIEIARKIRERKEQAFFIRDNIRALEIRVSEAHAAGLDTSRTEEDLERAKRSFERENYEEAEEWILQGNRELSEVEAQRSLLRAKYASARDNLITKLKEGWKKIVGALIVLTAAGIVSYNRFSQMLTERKREDLELEKKVLEELAKKTQEEYFKLGKMSKEVYHTKSRKIRERLREIEEELAKR